MPYKNLEKEAKDALKLSDEDIIVLRMTLRLSGWDGCHLDVKTKPKECPFWRMQKSERGFEILPAHYRCCRYCAFKACGILTDD